MTHVARTGSRQPIMIFGVCRRSGTNFLTKLLQCHKDCVPPASPLAEDHLLREAKTLVTYARRTGHWWRRRWGDRDEAQASLERHLGSGLMAFLEARADGYRVVSKTPSVDNLILYPRFFPSTYVLLLVRDGRSASESLVQGFHWTYERATREWHRGAKAILEFQQYLGENGSGLRVLLVRYEELIEQFEMQLLRILEFLDLDPSKFDLREARSLPVFGSSYVRDSQGEMKWGSAEKTDSFDSLRRFESWSRARHERFNWIAGNEQRALGYEIKSFNDNRAWWTAYNLICDVMAPIVLTRDVVRSVHLWFKDEYRWRRRTHSNL